MAFKRGGVQGSNFGGGSRGKGNNPFNLLDTEDLMASMSVETFNRVQSVRERGLSSEFTRRIGGSTGLLSKSVAGGGGGLISTLGTRKDNLFVAAKTFCGSGMSGSGGGTLGGGTLKKRSRSVNKNTVEFGRRGRELVEDVGKLEKEEVAGGRLRRLP